MTQVFSSTPPPIQQTPPLKKAKNKTLMVLLIILFSLIGLIILCFIIAMLVYGTNSSKNVTQESTKVNSPIISNSETPKPTFQPIATSTSIPSPSPTIDNGLNLTAQEFVNYYDGLTNLQTEDYLLSVRGKYIVNWSGNVSEVNSDGTIIVDIPGSLFNQAYLSGVPLDIAKTINKDDVVIYSGVIEKVDNLLGLSIYIKNTKLKK